jgi:hypothetical protein
MAELSPERRYRNWREMAQVARSRFSAQSVPS